nr:phosphopantothenoylcysteine decarboxylase subunit SIS2-like [Lolium perenne]
MDFIWHEMRDCAFLLEAPSIYALSAGGLRCLKWDRDGSGDLLDQCRPNITIHKEKAPCPRIMSLQGSKGSIPSACVRLSPLHGKGQVEDDEDKDEEMDDDEEKEQKDDNDDDEDDSDSP